MSVGLEAVDDLSDYSSVVIEDPSLSLLPRRLIGAMLVVDSGQRVGTMGSPDQKRQPWLPWPPPGLISQASHSAFLVKHHMWVDNPSVGAPGGLVLAHLVAAVREESERTGSWNVVDEEVGS